MANVYDINGALKGEVSTPEIFRLPVRHDIIQRAFLAERSHQRMPYGADALAGKRTSAHYHGSKGYFMTMKNREISRVARVHGSSPGQNFRARFAPHTRSGRAAHPPKKEKIFFLKINKKERRKALFSAIAATADAGTIAAKYNITNIELPLVVCDEIEGIKKSREIKNLLLSLKLKSELERAKTKKIRAGRGKMRGRKYRKKQSILIVVKDDKGIMRAARNLRGINVCKVSNLSVSLLAPAGNPGRLTLWSEGAVKELENLYRGTEHTFEK